MVDFMAKTKGDKILIICDNADAKILEPLRTQNRFELKQIHQTILTQYGLFSVYNLYIYPQKEKNRKTAMSSHTRFLTIPAPAWIVSENVAN
jgi:hypothetical protein